jgi:hypothetical protein
MLSSLWNAQFRFTKRRSLKFCCGCSSQKMISMTSIKKVILASFMPGLLIENSDFQEPTLEILRR